MTKKSKLVLGLASMLGVSAGATAVSGFAWFATTKSADIDITNIGIYSKSSGLNVQLKSGAPLIGCTNNNSDVGDINLVGATGAEVKEYKDTEDAEQKTFELRQYPSGTVTAKVGNDAVTVSTVSGKNVTLSAAPGASKTVEFTYTPYAALTDTSSIDGQNIYKPVWTASGEGQYATSLAHNAGEGYIQFTMTLTASGNSDLEIYLDRAYIDPVDTAADSADTYAADITRVAFVEDKALPEVDETLLILQNDTSTNDRGIDSTKVGDFNYDSDDADSVNDLYDITGLTSAVNSSYFAAPEKTVAKANQPGSWGTDANHKNKTNNWLCTLRANETKDIIVTIWLEGTSGNTGGLDKGSFINSPENGMIKVHVPLVAF